MRYIVKVSTYAKADRNGITEYLAQFSAATPIKFERELRKCIEIVGDMPNIFSKYSSNPNYRHVVVFGSYIMFYVVDEKDKTVFIYRILHGSQDIVNIL